MKKFLSWNMLSLLAMVVVLSSCLSKITLEDDEILQQNESQIKAYIAANNLSATKAPNGVYYQVTKVDTSGRKMIFGDTVRVHYVLSRLDGYVLSSAVLNKDKPFQFINGYSTSLFVNLLPYLHEGETGTFIIPSTMALGSQTLANLPANSPLRCDIQWFKTFSEEADIDRYVRDNKITLTGRYSNGLRYLRVKEGTGDYLASGKVAQVKYTGKYLNGVVFDTNVGKSDTLSVTAGGSSVITGFQRGVELMRVGEKALFIFPSSIGYGTTGSGKIPGETPLIFEVEFLSIKQ